MAKDKERKTAYILYVKQGKTAKEVASLVGVSEKTISGKDGWVNKYGWKAARNAKITSYENRIDNIHQLIDDFAENRLKLQKELTEIALKGGNKERTAEIRQDLARIDSGVANWNKTLEQVDKENRISLGTYINVMDRIFKALRAFDIEIYMQTIAFQEHHIVEKSIELG